jgi:hypothetical protein
MSASTAIDDQEERSRFFHALLGDELPPGLWGHTWRPSPKRSDWIRTAEDAEASARQKDRRDVYIGVGLAGAKGTPSERVKTKTAAGLLAVIGDIDIKGDAHKQSALPPDEESAKRDRRKVL